MSLEGVGGGRETSTLFWAFPHKLPKELTLFVLIISSSFTVSSLDSSPAFPEVNAKTNSGFLTVQPAIQDPVQAYSQMI